MLVGGGLLSSIGVSVGCVVSCLWEVEVVHGGHFHLSVSSRGRSCTVMVVHEWVVIFGCGHVGCVHSCGPSLSVGPCC